MAKTTKLRAAELFVREQLRKDYPGHASLKPSMHIGLLVPCAQQRFACNGSPICDWLKV